MPEFFKSLFSSNSFMPHGHCYLWRSDILWLNAGSDAVIALAYYAIPAFLVYLVNKRKDLAFNWIFIMFALFILACGTTHIVEIWTIWNPQYGIQGIVKLFTAGISMATAFALVPLMPKALALPSVKDLEESSHELQRLNKELLQVNATLEYRVAEKTKDTAALAAIVRNSNDPIISSDVNGCITSWNPAAQLLFGDIINEPIGKSIYDLIPENYRTKVNDRIHQTEYGGTPKVFDIQILNRNSEQLHISLTFSPIKDDLGNFIGSSLIARDITSRIRAEQEIKKSEARKTAILNASLDAIITIDHTGTIIEWNTMAEKTFGFSSAQVLGKELAEVIIPHRYRKAHRDGLLHYLKTGEGPVIGKRVELSALRANGDEFPVEISIAALAINQGPPFFTASVRDITTRLQNEEALKKNEDRFRRVIEATPNGLVMVGQTGKIVLCNAEIESLFGYKKEELFGQEIEILVPQRFRKNHSGYRQEFFHGPETRQMGVGRDLYGLRKDGTEFSVEIGLNPLVTEEGVFVLASVVDITKRKALEEHIRHSTEAMEQKNYEMEQFVYTVSHDLKSPLVTSTGFLGLLKEDLLAHNYDKLMDSVTRLERANSRMSQLIDDLLQLSRIGRIKIEPEEIHVPTLLKAICENLSSQIQEKSVQMDISPEMPAIKADRKRIYQVFENLIINALKYACDGPDPRITIGFEKMPGETRFYVKDNGPGIAKVYHKKIFGLFQRLETDNRGTGVGLTIVSRIMQLHGGRAWVESTVGAGATFWLAFPNTFVSLGGTDGE